MCSVKTVLADALCWGTEVACCLLSTSCSRSDLHLRTTDHVCLTRCPQRLLERMSGDADAIIAFELAMIPHHCDTSNGFHLRYWARSISWCAMNFTGICRLRGAGGSMMSSNNTSKLCIGTSLKADAQALEWLFWKNPYLFWLTGKTEPIICNQISY